MPIPHIVSLEFIVQLITIFNEFISYVVGAGIIALVNNIPKISNFIADIVNKLRHY